MLQIGIATLHCLDGCIRECVNGVCEVLEWVLGLAGHVRNRAAKHGRPPLLPLAGLLLVAQGSQVGCALVARRLR